MILLLTSEYCARYSACTFCIAEPMTRVWSLSHLGDHLYLVQLRFEHKWLRVQRSISIMSPQSQKASSEHDTITNSQYPFCRSDVARLAIPLRSCASHKMSAFVATLELNSGLFFTIKSTVCKSKGQGIQLSDDDP
ncbi:unnamed protein product [Albugo candida]|uniref:Uncharacterized protein n=1 Tax=Albugo candida TaxID=65357 RepID=A0A024FZZ4_9STRA|nr:unnamed protein product [Albugo candida]|eukprot:CCI39863.1 unnamed protein product [Albugo candida]